MVKDLCIQIIPDGSDVAQKVDYEPDYEWATTGKLVMRSGDDILTAFTVTNKDLEPGTFDGPRVSCYYLAEWLAWNWFRLRWETEDTLNENDKEQSVVWHQSHRIAECGNGYLWPDITIVSKGDDVEIRSASVQAQYINYHGAAPVVVPGDVFEQAVDDYIQSVFVLLDKYGIKETDLHTIWAEVDAERKTPDVYLFRQVEAMMGIEPGEDDANVEKCIGHINRNSDMPIRNQVFVNRYKG